VFHNAWLELVDAAISFHSDCLHLVESFETTCSLWFNRLMRCRDGYAGSLWSFDQRHIALISLRPQAQHQNLPMARVLGCRGGPYVFIIQYSCSIFLGIIVIWSVQPNDILVRNQKRKQPLDTPTAPSTALSLLMGPDYLIITSYDKRTYTLLPDGTRT
jgi:hypothetical protein